MLPMFQRIQAKKFQIITGIDHGVTAATCDTVKKVLAAVTLESIPVIIEIVALS